VPPKLALAASAVLVAALLPATAALAAPLDDFKAVFADWRSDGDVTACRFPKATLVNARNLASSNADFDSYAPGFRDEVGREIARHDSGGCRGIAPDSPQAQALSAGRDRLRTRGEEGQADRLEALRMRGAPDLG